MSRSIRILVISALFIICLAALQPGPIPTALAQGGNTVIVNTGSANIRSGPAPNTTSLGSVTGGVQMAVTGRNTSSTWWRVESPFGTGWISGVVVIFRGDYNTVPIVSEPVGTLEPNIVIVDRYPATVYRNPNEDSFVVGIAPTGSSLLVLGRTNDGDWWQVQTNVGAGFVKITEVAFRGTENSIPRVGDPGPSFNGPTIRVNVDTVVTTEPGSGEVITTLPAGTVMPTGGRTADNSYWQVAGIFGIGWVPVDQVSLAGAASNLLVTSNYTVPDVGEATGKAVATITIEADRKVAYNEPSFASVPMWDARLGEVGGIVGRTEDGLWLQITMKGYIGWMHFSGLTLQGSISTIPIIDTTPPPPPPNIAIVNTHWLYVRSGPGVGFTRVGAAPGGASLLVTGRHPTKSWLRVEGEFGVGWANVIYLIFRGDWSAVPRVTEPEGEIELPGALITSDQTVFSQPMSDMPLGTIPAGTYIIVGRNVDYSWAMLATPLGNVWIPYNLFYLQGVEANIPVIQ